MTSPQMYQIGERSVPLTPVEQAVRSVNVTAGEEITVLIESVTDEPKRNAALVEIHFQDKSGQRLDIPNWGRNSKSVGTFTYLSTDTEGIGFTRIKLLAPEGSERLVLLGNQWRKSATTHILGEFIVLRAGSDDSPKELFSGEFAPRPISDFDQVLDLPAEASRIKLSLDAYFPTPDSKAILRVGYSDPDRKVLLPPVDLSQSPVNGPFLNLKADGNAGTRTCEFEMDIRPGVSQLTLHGVALADSSVEIMGSAAIESLSDGQPQIDTFLDSIPEDGNLIVIDTTAPPLGDDTRALRPNNLAHAFVKQGCWVIFLPFSSLQTYPAHVGERLLQVPRSHHSALMNALHERRGKPGTFICSSFCSISSIALATLLKTAGWQIVYEARDDMEEFNRVGYSKWYAPALERAMLRIADKTVSVSRALDEKLLSLVPHLSDHVVIPNAVNQSTIDAGAPLRTPEAFAYRDQSRTVGYVGHLTPSWFDWPKIIEAATELPDVTFEIIGHGAPKDIKVPDNVKLHEAMTHEELVDVVKHWKVGLIPFLDIPLTRSVDPNKIYEYFAWGLRCISAPMGMVETYPSTYVYNSTTELIEHIKTALDSPFSNKEISELESMVARSSWDNRASTLLAHYGLSPQEA